MHLPTAALREDDLELQSAFRNTVTFPGYLRLQGMWTSPHMNERGVPLEVSMKHFRWVLGAVTAAGISLTPFNCVAQTKMTTVPDAQVESNVLKALASDSKLADQAITSTTVYGTVTLSGSVRDEESRKLAETIVSRTAGVQKVVDELTLGTDTASTAPAAGNPENPNDGGSNPMLQSDGTMAPSPSQPGSEANEQTNSAPPPPPQNSRQTPYSQQPPYGQPQTGQQPSYSQQPPYGQQPSNQDPRYTQQPYGQAGPGPQPPPSSGSYGPPYRRPYGQPPYAPSAPAYQQPNPGPAPYGAQVGGHPVSVPSGSMLRVRINQGLDSKHTQPGTVFDAVVLNDVVADGFVAIPRGAMVHGTVVDSQSAGALKGRGELALQLTGVTLAGRSYPIATDIWSNTGGDKTARTVNSALGLGVVGAIIGGVAGGGAGAAIGAGVGGAAGVGASAASGGGQAFIPSEAILTFHLTQQAALTTVSQAEMDRLGYGVPVGAQMRRRYVQPQPYGYPVYYPRYPYPYPY